MSVGIARDRSAGGLAKTGEEGREAQAQLREGPNELGLLPTLAAPTQVP